MIRALWYFIQLCVVAGAAIWLASRPGAVDIAWQDYTLSVQLGAFLLAFVVLVILMMAIFKVIGLIVGLPGRYKNYRGLKAREKGYQSLTRGFVALAAGDAKKATQYATARATRQIPRTVKKMTDRRRPLIMSKGYP